MPTAIKRANNRMDTVLDAAAQLFATKGFRETSTRDIAALAEIQPGSLYYHFAKKDDVLLAVYRKGVDRLCARVAAEAALFSEPWTRLQAALRAHLETILEKTHYARVLLRVVPESAPEIASQLVELRDEYEDHLRHYFNDLPLPDHVDRTLIRLLILGAANHTQVWHKSGRQKPSDIAAQLVDMVRAQAQQPIS